MSFRKIKVRLWNKDPNCHWCGVKTDLTNEPTGILHTRAATLDHKVSQLYPEERKKNSGYFLTCYECNNLRGQWDNLVKFYIGPEETEKWKCAIAFMRRRYEKVLRARENQQKSKNIVTLDLTAAIESLKSAA